MGIIRLLLAISVVMVHTTPILGNTLVRGTIAVQAFYIISGFYMALILNEKYVADGSYKLFISNRLLRIYPTYVVVLALTFLLYAVPFSLWGRGGGTVAQYLQYEEDMGLGAKVGLFASTLGIFGQDVLMFLGFDRSAGEVVFAPNPPLSIKPMGHFLLIPQAWTIALELTFYLVAPFVVRRSTTHLLVLISGCLLLRFVTYAAGYNEDPWTYRFFPFELGFFLMGAVGYKVFRRNRNHAWAGPAGWVAFVFVVIATIVFQYVPGSFIVKQWTYYTLFASAVPFIFCASCRVRFDRWLGELSYPVYMSHMLVLGIVGYQTRWPYIPEEYLGLAVSLASVAFSVCLTTFVLQPIEAIRQSRADKATHPPVQPVLASERLQA